MSTANLAIRRLGARLQRRFTNARPGSVLILVVALLVLMALIGTAWLSTTRTDRFTVQQSKNNTQIDLLVEGMVNQTKAAQLGDLPGRYDNVASDGFIASRVPTVLREVAPIWTPTERAAPINVPPGAMDPPRPRKFYEGQIVRYTPAAVLPATAWEYYVCTATHVVNGFDDPNRESRTYTLAPPTGAHPYWEQIGFDAEPPSPVGDATDPTRRVYGMTPVWPILTRLFDSTKFEDIGPGVPAVAGSQEFDTRSYAIPTTMDFGGDPKFPAFWIYHPSAIPGAPVGGGAAGGLVKVPAADADGDGVADSLLMRIPVGTLDGLDYFAAIRVVDNNSAVNFNTALSSAGDFNFATPPVQVGFLPLIGMYKSHVGLYEWLNPDNASASQPRYREMSAWNLHRMGYTWNGNPNWTPPTQNSASNTNTTFTFATIGEALETDLTRRLGNPVGPYRTYSVGEGTSLHYRAGVLRNPDASPTLLQRVLSEVNPDPLAPLPGDWQTNPAYYDPLYERAPNTGRQTWTKYTDAPLSYGPRRDGSSVVAHTYDPTTGPPPGSINGGWPTFIWRWFDENYNQWGYTDNPQITPANSPPDNQPTVLWTPPPRLLMGADQHDLHAAGTNDIRRGLAPFLVSRNALSTQAPLKAAAGTTIAPSVTVGTLTTLAMETAGPAHARTSVNAATFGQLWRAYWAVMAQNWTPDVLNPDGTEILTIPANHTPFTEVYRLARDTGMVGTGYTMPAPITPGSGAWHNDPFYGMGFASSINVSSVQEPDTTRQHFARMFRNVLRPTFVDETTPYTPDTFRLQPDQILLLRSAIAAANTRELLDDNDSITPIDIAIPESADRTRDEGTYPGEGRGGSGVPLVARIYGQERQPFITEVYADSNNGDNQNPLSQANGLTNPNGYIAIELHNPHNVAIDIRFCKLATINRQDGSGATPRNGPTAAGPTVPVPLTYFQGYQGAKLVVQDRTLLGVPAAQQVPAAETIILYDPSLPVTANVAKTNMEMVGGTGNYHDPWVIPAGGYLVLENYDSGASGAVDPEAAVYRPPALRVHPGGVNDIEGSQGPIKTQDPTTFIPPALMADPTHEQFRERTNFVYVPHLERLMDQEFVLVRPLGAAIVPGVNVAGSGQDVLQYIELPTATGPSLAYEMAPLDSYDLTGLHFPNSASWTAAGGRAHAWHYNRANMDKHNTTTFNRAWRFVYPGRYDGNKSAVPPGTVQRPRFQGTDEAREPDFTAMPPGEGTALGWNPQTYFAHPWEKQPAGPSGGEFDVGPDPGFSIGTGRARGAGTQAERAGYPREFTIQLSQQDFPGPRAGGAAASYPHGGFARNGDILQVPFIGAYRIQRGDMLGTPNVMELNAVTMDAAFAEDTEPTNDPLEGEAVNVRREQIGRFCPLPATDLTIAGRGTLDEAQDNPPTNVVRDLERTGNALNPELANRWAGLAPHSSFYDIVITNGTAKGRTRSISLFAPATRDMTSPTPWSNPANPRTDDFMPPIGSQYQLRRGTYRWATDLFDHLTVHNPALDFMPNNVMHPAAADPTAPVSNYGATANSAAELTAPTHGSININTAPWRVLATLPLLGAAGDLVSFVDHSQQGVDPPVALGLPPTEHAPGRLLIGTGNGVPDNYDIARAIVAHRDAEIAAGADPMRVFESIFDLYRVPGILQYSDAILLAAEPDNTSGDLSPILNATTPDGLDHARGDFEEQWLYLTHLSNLITTRSDTFTNYLIVQGWRGVGNTVAGDEELVVQRRRSFVSDRSGVAAGAADIPIEYFFNE